MSYFNLKADKDNKPDSPLMKDQITNDPYELGSSRIGKRNQHVIEHQIQIRQSDNLKMMNTRTYMKSTTEQKFEWEQFLT